MAVLFIDLDDFKVANDSLGHEAGDLLLTVVAQCLEKCLRPEDTLARFGGNEFTVLIESVEGAGDGVRVAQRITDELRRPFALEDRELYVSDTDTDQLSRTTGRLSYGKHRAKVVAEDAAGNSATMTRSFRMIRGARLPFIPSHRSTSKGCPAGFTLRGYYEVGCTPLRHPQHGVANQHRN